MNDVKRITTMSKKELAALYNVHRDTIQRWCQRIGIETKKGLLTPKNVRQLYDEYGVPG